MKPALTHPPGRRIGFISTRFAGTDGVSLETEKWAAVLERHGHTCFYFSGQSDRPADRSRVVPEAFFGHPVIAAIGTTAFDNEWGTGDLVEYANPALYPLHNGAFYHHIRPPAATRRIHEIKELLKAELYAFAREFSLELLIVQNALAIPMNIPLGLAITEFIAETGFPTIAHHHDFYWERQRFMVSCVGDYLAMAFPPRLPSIRHVTINSLAAYQLSVRTGLSSMLIPNVMDFEHPPEPPDDYARGVRAALGLAPDECLILQPTRVVQRKGIEHAIELVARLGLNARLVISHAAGDEGSGYQQRLVAFAAMLEVPVSFVVDRIAEQRGVLPDGRPIFTLWDVYPQADLVTYPSSIEGFGNAFLEAVYFRRPVVVNNYSIFDLDIKPKGFRVIEFDGYITPGAVQHARRLLEEPVLAQDMVEHNYRLAAHHYSYATLERHLETLIGELYGEQA